jgi:hypothetical protein
MKFKEGDVVYYKENGTYHRIVRYTDTNDNSRSRGKHGAPLVLVSNFNGNCGGVFEWRFELVDDSSEILALILQGLIQ